MGLILTKWAAAMGAVLAIGGAAGGMAAETLRVLIVDGENGYHDWQVTTPLLERILEGSGRFVVDVATIPPTGEDSSAFRPPLHDYKAVLINYNSQTPPPPGFKTDLVEFVHGGGGLICVHASSNAWAEWPEYNEMTGLGGWYGRDERWGPYVYYQDGKLVRDDAAGPCGHHGPQHEYVIQVREPEHPIVRGLPATWLHAKDELYDTLRGPAKNLTVLATAFSYPEFDGTDRDEPMLMTVAYGDGRVFHTAMGHADYSMKCVGFITTLLRGAEWAASGDVTIGVPEDFPTTSQVQSRD